jgi:hypothetical protein
MGSFVVPKAHCALHVAFATVQNDIKVLHFRFFAIAQNDMKTLHFRFFADAQNDEKRSLRMTRKIVKINQTIIF